MVNSDLNKDSNSRTDRSPGLGRDTFNLPNFVSLDPRITKSIPFTERVKAQLILEAYNVLNRTNYTSVSNRAILHRDGMYWHRDHLPGASEDAISDAAEHAIELQPWLENCPAFGQDYVLGG